MRVANFWVSSAGVILNLAIAISAGILIRVLLGLGVVETSGWRLVPAEGASDWALGLTQFLSILFRLNVGLFVFNLLPVPPLDGGRILSSILPDSFAPALDMIAQYGIVLLYVAMFTGVIGTIFVVVMPLAYALLFIGT